MNEFIAQYCHRNDDRINRDLFTRTYDRPLADYLVDTCKNLEVIPGLTLEDYELITDQTKIRMRLNKRNVKDPKIKNNKCLERLVQPTETLNDMLVLHFRIEVDGEVSYQTRNVLVLKPIRGGMYIRNGRKVRVLNQVVDNSTFVKQDKNKTNILNFKTKLYAIKLLTAKTKLRFTDGTVTAAQSFRLDLLTKTVNPILYYLAKRGLESTLEYFDLDRVISVVTRPVDEGHYMYLQVSPKAYLEVHEKAFYGMEFIMAFVASLYDAMVSDPNIRFRDIYDQDYWKCRLSEIFSKKKSTNKADRILVSFEKIMDVGVKKNLVLRKHHRRDTYSIVRWMMTNYGQLLKKDSHDLQFKRIRANETLAYFFDKHISTNAYSLLNTDNPGIEKYKRFLRSINEYTLLKGAHGGAEASPTSMFRYERYNDFDAIEIARYTLKGPTGLNGGKNGVSWKYRDIYASQLGRYDVNVCSSSDPGLTGYLCANVKIDDRGYFSSERNEPDVYDPVIDGFLSRFADPDFKEKREKINEVEKSRDKDDFVVLRHRYGTEWFQHAAAKNPMRFGLYKSPDDGFLKLIPNMGPRDAKGFMTIRKKKVRREAPAEMPRDEDGFVVLTRTVTKLGQKMAKK